MSGRSIVVHTLKAIACYMTLALIGAGASYRSAQITFGQAMSVATVTISIAGIAWMWWYFYLGRCKEPVDSKKSQIATIQTDAKADGVFANRTHKNFHPLGVHDPLYDEVDWRQKQHP